MSLRYVESLITFYRSITIFDGHVRHLHMYMGDCYSDLLVDHVNKMDNFEFNQTLDVYEL